MEPKLIFILLQRVIGIIRYFSFKLCYQEDTPYIVQFKVTNKAGLYTIKDSPPVLYDLSTPTPGKVIAGKDFLKEQVWFSSGKAVTGIEVLTKHEHILDNVKKRDVFTTETTVIFLT